MNKILFVSGNYRRTRIQDFIEANSFGAFKSMGYISSLNFSFFSLKAFYYNLKMLLSDIIIVSDIDGIEYLNYFLGLKKKSINLLMWNSEKELERINVKDLKLRYTNLKICFFFKDAALKASELYQIKTKHLISPIIPFENINSSPLNRIIYCSEVNLFTEDLKNNIALDEEIWKYTERIVEEDSYLLCTNELVLNHFKDFEYKFNITWVLKNRVRYLYAKKLKRNFNEKFVLVGDDWIKLGFEALPSNYDTKYLFNLYSNSKICLDLLSKSSNEALFERVMQIISTSNGLIQLKTIESEAVYGSFHEERTFKNISELINKINIVFSLKQAEFNEKGENFRKFIKDKSFQFA